MGVNRPLSFFEQSRRRNYDMSQDTLVDYAGTNHVRILKRFESPSDHPPESPEAKLISPDYNRVFHLRFYIPKTALINKEQKIRDLVIMFNGLNEVERFDLYDLLGQHLSDQGIGAVLLPTPYHLNRSHPPKGSARRQPHQVLFRFPILMYYNYKQSMLDSDLLLQKLRGTKTDEVDCGFYEAIFDRRLRISTIGFSLGGLRALASFHYEPSHYHTCIVFNSGVQLSLLNTKPLGIENADWDNFVAKLHKEVRQQRRSLRSEQLLESFDDVYLGKDPFWLKERLREHSQKLLFILSGGDPIVPPNVNPIEVEGHGLTVLKIAGVGHIPTMDPQWSPWLGRVSDFIARFVTQASREVWFHQDIIDETRKILAESQYFRTLQPSEQDFQSDDLRRLLDSLSPQNRPGFLRLFYASMAYYPRFREVLNAIIKKNVPKAAKSESKIDLLRASLSEEETA